MERLTIPDKKIDGGWKRAFIDTEEVRKCAMSIYWALKKYEDTGLTPPEVQELKERDTKKPLTDLKACPNCGRYIGDDIRPYCHSCVQRLELED